MLLAPEALRRRITRLQALIAHLERLPAIDMAEYGKDIALQLRVERVVIGANSWQVIYWNTAHSNWLTRGQSSC